MVSGRVTSAPALPAGVPMPRVGPTRPPPYPAVVRPGEMDIRCAGDVREVALGPASLRDTMAITFRVDPRMPPGEVWICDGKQVIRLVNVGGQ